MKFLFFLLLLIGGVVALGEVRGEVGGNMIFLGGILQRQH